MTVPKRIKILGRAYKVSEGDPSALTGYPALGVTEHLDELIMVEDSLKESVKRSTLLHEVFHAVAFTQAHSMPEDAIEAMSYGLYRVMRDNPKLVEYLTS